MVNREDLPALRQVLDSIELFPSHMLADMISDYVDNPDSKDIWFTAVEDGRPVSIGYCAPETLTEGTYNLYAIGVHGNLQGKGIGRSMIGFLESYLIEKGHRILLVDTSGSDDFALTRRFYEKLGYKKEAVIRDFWKEGDDKVTYRKKLS